MKTRRGFLKSIIGLFALRKASRPTPKSQPWAIPKCWEDHDKAFAVMRTRELAIEKELMAYRKLYDLDAQRKICRMVNI